MHHQQTQDLYRLWVEEFERKAAIRRQVTLARSAREPRGGRAFLSLLRLHRNAHASAVVARRAAQAQQCG
jgi:hypothetical protein